ncbi:DUF3108 domain-containing protein [Enterovirga rhinocerotis]|uniref:Uncharacterized protein DUF3108 n=1 Tax=Enterovirga rhinocerotis TaxID=1339210 RepID=A0A4R7C627_9HYPH|nr:DUF3108 domain-containing protein [Enterovirga rhinocerotis]TDR93858.1 uncharacterized protein DUF3108 [Enterovirga rhinocerotis]
MRLLKRLSFAFAALSVVAPSAASAQSASLRVDYAITLAGLALGNAGLDGTFDDTRYDMKLTGKLTGLVGALSGNSVGGAAARGVVSNARVVSNGFSAQARSGSNERTVMMGVASGNVTSISIVPPFERRHEVVPLSDNDRRNIVDPLSGLVTVAANPGKLDDAANCNRTVPVFDGTQRFDIVMSYGGMRVVRKPGFTGPVVVCNVRYRPVAGHRADRPSVEFMRNNREMSVWLAPVQGTRLLVPIRISVQTMVGLSVVEAQRWAVNGR